MRLTVLPEAELEASEAAIWYEVQREGLGGEFLTELRGALTRIPQAPQSAAVLESYSGPYEVRRYRLNRFPYLGSLLVLAGRCHCRGREPCPERTILLA